MQDQNDIVYTAYGPNVGDFLRTTLEFFTGSGGADGVIDTLWFTWKIIAIISFVVSALFMYVIVYSKIRLEELEEIEDRLYIHEPEEYYAHVDSHGSKNQRWEDAVVHIESDNPNDWRLAIIEADIMLEDLLDTLGYAGMTIGDKLKQASPQFMKTLDDAWRAHRTRNEIAHKGSDFILTKRVAKETLEQYRRTFEEFEII